MNGSSRGNAIWRLFFVQSSRNERTLDGLGFFSALAPLIPTWGRSFDERRSAARRHAGYFNANPILASYVAGVVANLEERRARGEEISAERIDGVKSTLSSVLTARGDAFFERALLPLGLTIASIFAMSSSYIGLVIFLVLYNAYHLQHRVGGYLKGMELGEGIGGAYVARLFREQRYLDGGAAFASGIFAAIVLAGARGAGGIELAVAGGVLAALVIALRGVLPYPRRVVILALSAAAYLVARIYVITAIRS